MIQLQYFNGFDSGFDKRQTGVVQRWHSPHVSSTTNERRSWAKKEFCSYVFIFCCRGDI